MRQLLKLFARQPPKVSPDRWPERYRAYVLDYVILQGYTRKAAEALVADWERKSREARLLKMAKGEEACS